MSDMSEDMKTTKETLRSVNGTLNLVYTIPAVPPSLNQYQRWHWARRNKERERFQEMLWAVMNEKGNRCPRNLARVELHAVIAFPKRRRRDSDNFGSVLWKWTQDLLVSGGIVSDDTSDRVTSYPPMLVDDQPSPQTTVIIVGHLKSE